MTIVDPVVTANALIMVDVATGAQKPLVRQDRNLLLEWPNFFPDQSKVLVRGDTGYDPTGIWSLDLTSGQLGFVTQGYEAAIAPSAALAAVFVGPGYQMTNINNWAIRVVPLSNPASGTDIFTSSVKKGYVNGMTWSPDSSKIAYSFTDIHDPAQSSTATLHIFTLSGVQPNNWPIDVPNYVFPAWSADGNYLAAISVENGYDIQGALVIWDLSTGCQEKLAGLKELTSPTWSPDGQQIAFTYRDSIYLLRLSDARANGALQRSCN